MQNATALDGDDLAASCQQPVTGLTLQEAAAILGVSLGKVRRQISAGQIHAERIDRPQGYVWRVYLDGRQNANQDAEQPPTSTLPQDAGGVPRPPGTDIMRAEAMAAYTRSLLEPLVAHVAELEGTIRDQAETIGRQSAELERAATIAVKLSDELEVQRAPRSPNLTPEPFWSRWWTWAPWLLAVLAIAVVIMLLVPR